MAIFNSPLNVSIGSSVVKREARDIEIVEEKLQADGWDKTAEVLGGRVRYFENSGVNITVMDQSVSGGTLIFPSGPVRGLIFGSPDAVEFGRNSSTIGLGGRSRVPESRSRGRGNEIT